MQTILDRRQDNEEEGSLFNRGTQVKMFEDREEYMLASVARRLQGKSKSMSPFEAFNAVQDHVLHTAQAHIDRVVLEAFVAGIDSCEDDEAMALGLCVLAFIVVTLLAFLLPAGRLVPGTVLLRGPPLILLRPLAIPAPCLIRLCISRT